MFHIVSLLRFRVAIALFLLYKSASGYALLEAHGPDEIGHNTEAVRNSVSDLNRFGKVVKCRSFNPFNSFNRFATPFRTSTGCHSKKGFHLT
ncbi:Nucleolar protein 56 [Glycine soja]|uniref:Nucleolar protein 56 n=1 Tax=Glycine soja TaxID=3848 RepID=A0A0B2PAR3_GLYSO|nr:Nucleolar protein 56 [Glycine soja]